MNNTKRSNKKALGLSVLSLVLCLAMFVGSTFAWFTDNDTATVSNVVTGTLDVEIVDKEGKELDVLKFVNKDGSADILWEPGASFMTQGFQIKNNGKLWLKYKVEVNNTEVSYNKLNEVIKFTLVDEKGEELKLNEMLDKPLEPGQTNTEGLMYIKGTMSEDAGNEYQDETMAGVSITVYAAQYTKEVDMTSDQYDKDAVYGDTIVTVGTPAEFVAAFQNLKAGQTVTLTADIDMTGMSWTPVDNKSYTLDGGNHIITRLNGGMSDHTGSGEITIKNVTFDKLVDNSTTNYAGLIGDADTCSYINMTNVTITNANISSAKYAAGFAAYTSGYGNDYDGPVYASHNFTNCTLTDSKVIGGGSTGGLIGHAGGNKATTTTINGVKVSNCTIEGEDAAHTGTLIGTSHVGVVYLNYTESDVQAGNIIGRFLPGDTGKLVVNGVEQ